MTPETPDKESVLEALWPESHPPPKRDVRCRHCGVKNRVLVSVAALTPRKVRCGGCDGALFLGPDEPLVGLTSQSYQHPLDKASLKALKALPGFGALMRRFLGTFAERAFHLHCRASFIACDDDQFPELHTLLDRARTSLNVDHEPRLFLSESPNMNALTLGAEKSLIVVMSSLLDQMSDDELVFVLGHELGHLHADHIVYKTLARLLVNGSAAMNDILRALTLPLQVALLQWDRASELTSDRAGLLACRDVGASLGASLVLSGGRRPGITSRTRLKLSAFVRQARELRDLEQESWWDAVLVGQMEMGRSHPYVAWRVMHLVDWVETGNYLDLLAGDFSELD